MFKIDRYWNWKKRMNATHAIPKTSHRNPIDCVVTFIKKKKKKWKLRTLFKIDYKSNSNFIVKVKFSYKFISYWMRKKGMSGACSIPKSHIGIPNQIA